MHYKPVKQFSFLGKNIGLDGSSVNSCENPEGSGLGQVAPCGTVARPWFLDCV